MKKIYSALAILLFFASACQTAKPPAVNAILIPPTYHSIGAYEGGELLPEGSYRLEASIKPKRGTARWITVYARKEADRIDFFGVDLFLKSLFRIEERFEKNKISVINANIQIIDPSMRANRQLIQDFYFSVRPFLLNKDMPKQANPIVFERHEDGRPKMILLSGKSLKHAKWIIDGYAEGARPESAHLLHPAWSVDLMLHKN